MGGVLKNKMVMYPNPERRKEAVKTILKIAHARERAREKLVIKKLKYREGISKRISKGVHKWAGERVSSVAQPHFKTLKIRRMTREELKPKPEFDINKLKNLFAED